MLKENAGKSSLLDYATDQGIPIQTSQFQVPVHFPGTLIKLLSSKIR